MAEDLAEKIFQQMHDRFDLPPSLDPVVKNLIVQYNPRYASLDRVTLTDITHQIRRLYPDSESWQRVKTMFRAIFVLIVFENNVSKRLDIPDLLRDYPEFAECASDEKTLLAYFRNLMIAALHITSPIGKKLELVALAARLVGQASTRNNTVTAPRMILIYERESNLTNRRKRKYDGPDDGKIVLRTNISGSEHLAATGYVGHYHYIKVDKKNKQRATYAYRLGTGSAGVELSTGVSSSVGSGGIGGAGVGLGGVTTIGVSGVSVKNTTSAVSNVDVTTMKYVTDPHQHNNTDPYHSNTPYEQEAYYPYNDLNTQSYQDYYDSLYNPAYNYLRNDVHRAVNSGFKFTVRPADIYETSDVIKDVGNANDGGNSSNPNHTSAVSNDYANTNSTANFSTNTNTIPINSVPTIPSTSSTSMYNLPNGITNNHLYAHTIPFVPEAHSYGMYDEYRGVSSHYPLAHEYSMYSMYHPGMNSMYAHTLPPAHTLPSTHTTHDKHTTHTTHTTHGTYATHPVHPTLHTVNPILPTTNPTNSTTQPVQRTTHATLPAYVTEYANMEYSKLLSSNANSGSDSGSDGGSDDEHEREFNIDINMEHVPFPSLLAASVQVVTPVTTSSTANTTTKTATPATSTTTTTAKTSKASKAVKKATKPTIASSTTIPNTTTTTSTRSTRSDDKKHVLTKSGTIGTKRK